MSGQIPLIYILSNGRSGTTLLDMLLGSSPAVWTVGEAQLLPWELRESHAPCGCGAELTDCSFWRSILPEIPVDEGSFPIDHFREQHGAGKVLRWRLLPGLLRGRTEGDDRRAAATYGRVNAEYLAAVRREARNATGKEVRWLVDASMDPYRLLWLQQSGRFRIRVVHLTKTPEGFVYSMTRNEEGGAHLLAVRMAGRWLLENALMVRLCHAALSSHQWRHVRYEDLASRPEVLRERFSEWLGVEFPAWEGKSFRGYTNHGVSGGRMRWEDSEIRLDTRWKRELPPHHRRVSRFLTLPVARLLGY